MRVKLISMACLLTTCATAAQAEWFFRGTSNNWGNYQMVNSATNTMEITNVIFPAAGSYKFDRFGNWAESYGVGGLNGSNINIAAGTYTIKFFTDTKNWSVNPATVFHLRGTFNSWAEGTLLTRVGTTDVYEKCQQFTGGDATGGPRFKVDPNGAWGDALPANDFAVSVGWVKVSYDASTRTVSAQQNLAANCGAANTSSSVMSTSTSVATSTSTSSAVTSTSSPTSTSSSRSSTSSTTSTSSTATTSSAASSDDFRKRTIYFTFVDRFANGNTNNDNGNNAAATSTTKSAGNEGEWKKYWGGDIAGLISKLDYLQSMGVTAIWVTPLVDNVDTGVQGGYHGYWGRDFYSVDEHLGDWALVDELNAQTEARGIKLILDIALNHSNQSDEVEFGNLLKEGGFVTNFASGKGTWYHNNGQIADCGDTNPATTCNGEWDDPWSFRNKSLFNLTDFNHGTNGTNSLADQYLIDAALKWMDHGIDGFRIDAIKHIEPGFVNRFSAAVKAKKADAYIFGEWYGAGSGDSLSMSFLNERRGSELLDFKLRDNIENAIAGNTTMTSLSTHIQSRPAAMGNNESLQTIFLDNHDATRTSVYLQTTGNTNRGAGKGMTKAFADARQNLGMALVMTLPGIPTIYYGTEQNTTWFTASGSGEIGNDPYNREQMPSFSQTTPAYTMIAALADLRKNSVAIQKGSYAERWVNADVLVFQRQSGTDCAVVAVNRGAATTITVPNLCLTNGAYTSKVGSDIVNISSGSGVFNLSQNEIVVLH